MKLILIGKHTKIVCDIDITDTYFALDFNKHIEEITIETDNCMLWLLALKDHLLEATNINVTLGINDLIKSYSIAGYYLLRSFETIKQSLSTITTEEVNKINDQELAYHIAKTHSYKNIMYMLMVQDYFNISLPVVVTDKFRSLHDLKNIDSAYYRIMKVKDNMFIKCFHNGIDTLMINYCEYKLIDTKLASSKNMILMDSVNVLASKVVNTVRSYKMFMYRGKATMQFNNNYTCHIIFNKNEIELYTCNVKFEIPADVKPETLKIDTSNITTKVYAAGNLTNLADAFSSYRVVLFGNLYEYYFINMNNNTYNKVVIDERVVKSFNADHMTYMIDNELWLYNAYKHKSYNINGFKVVSFTEHYLMLYRIISRPGLNKIFIMHEDELLKVYSSDDICYLL
jgi:hypothetical protein